MDESNRLSPKPVHGNGLEADRSPHHVAEARQVLHDIRDLLFVIEGAAEGFAADAGLNTRAALLQVLDAARQASNKARTLSATLDTPADRSATTSFDPNSRLQSLRAPLERCLPPGGTLRLRLAVGLWRVQGSAEHFDDAMFALVRCAAKAMAGRGRGFPLAILTSNRPASRPNGLVRVSIVSDTPWLAGAPDSEKAVRDFDAAVAGCGGRLLRGRHAGVSAVAHVDLRRSWSKMDQPALSPRATDRGAENLWLGKLSRDDGWLPPRVIIGGRDVDNQPSSAGGASPGDSAASAPASPELSA